MMCQCNTVDMSCRSPSYEACLAKYSACAFEVYVPSLSCADIDPIVSSPFRKICRDTEIQQIFERSIVRVTGPACLLVLEKLANTNERFAFIDSCRTLRGCPNCLTSTTGAKSASSRPMRLAGST
jgi:hypothetical protein